jgi:predicted NAD/FAD-dependent oxidoreductase
MNEPVIVIGAGLSGLLAAHTLQEGGRKVVVLDKGRGVGGRMATRRFGGAVFDHGAQFITVREPQFEELIECWRGAGIVTEWCRGFDEAADGHPRYRGEPAMTAIPKFLARSLPVHLAQRVQAIGLEGEQWVVRTEQGSTFTGSALVMTAPVPQALALLAAGQVVLPAASRAVLTAIRYEACLAVLAVLAGPSGLPEPGARQFANGPVAWVADNYLKGISPVPGVTVHATPAFSAAHWDQDRAAAGQQLLEVVRPELQSAVVEFQVHGWRYSKPVTTRPEPCLRVAAPLPLVFAGDAFGGPRVEGAALSGLAAAAALGC